MNRTLSKQTGLLFCRHFLRLPVIMVILISTAFPSCTPEMKPEQSWVSTSTPPSETLSAMEYHEKGIVAFEKGDFESAIHDWTQSEKAFRAIKNREKQCAVLVELSRAYQGIGLNNKAMEVLGNALVLAEGSRNYHHQAIVMAHLGNLYTLMGDKCRAEHYLSQSLSVSKRMDDPELVAAILNNQGNLYLLEKKYLDAVAAYTQSIETARTADSPLLTITALINLARAHLINDQAERVKPILDQALEKLNRLDDSHFKSYGLINTGLAYLDLETHLPEFQNEFRRLCHGIFSQAGKVAQRTNDYRAMSYASGYTGKLHEDERRHEEALAFTQTAVFAAQQVYAPESLYKWQWQAGRIFKQMNKIDQAVAAYRRTVFTLQSIHQAIDNCHDIQQASFRKIAGSVCFELVDLLLQQSKSLENKQEHLALLFEARDVVELLRVYELRNYFKDDCVDAGGFDTANLDSISKTAVVIYPVLLEDRTELLVSLPSGLKQFSIPVNQETITREIRAFRSKLEKRTTWEFLPHAQALYDNLIRPVEPDLSSMGADTLVFVPSGPLRTIPMAALHDGKRFLIHKYATVITPGLNLIDPTPIKRKNLKILAVGITRASQGFPPLPEVVSELQNISRLFSSKLLLDQDFSISNMETELRKEEFNIVHIASHGQFQGDVDQTFVLAFDEKLTMDTLDKYAGFLQFRKTPLDLLALSACESAAGDDLAALGMAGVAVKAGARSALATLWSIDDMASSRMIKQFYLQLKDPAVSRAMALQRAQLSLLEDPRYDHPGYWSAFLLINNWL